MVTVFNLSMIGNVGGEAEYRYSANGSPFMKFTLAVNSSKKNSSGQWDKITDWVNVVVFGKQAEYLNNNNMITRGTRVYVSGSVETSAYIDKSGSAKASLSVIARDIEVMTPRESTATSSSSQKTARTTATEEMDELPF